MELRGSGLHGAISAGSCWVNIYPSGALSRSSPRGACPVSAIPAPCPHPLDVCSLGNGSLWTHCIS